MQLSHFVQEGPVRKFVPTLYIFFLSSSIRHFMNSYIHKAVLLLHMTVVPPGMRNSDYYLEIMALFVVAIFSLCNEKPI